MIVFGTQDVHKKYMNTFYTWESKKSRVPSSTRIAQSTFYALQNMTSVINRSSIFTQ